MTRKSRSYDTMIRQIKLNEGEYTFSFATVDGKLLTREKWRLGGGDAKTFETVPFEIDGVDGEPVLVPVGSGLPDQIKRDVYAGRFELSEVGDLDEVERWWHEQSISDEIKREEGWLGDETPPPEYAFKIYTWIPKKFAWEVQIDFDPEKVEKKEGFI